MEKTSYKIVTMLFALALASGSLHTVSAADDAGQGFVPGERVLLEVHNCYPYQERWADQLERALGTGLPLAVEQDLVWHTDPTRAEAVRLRALVDRAHKLGYWVRFCTLTGDDRKDGHGLEPGV